MKVPHLSDEALNELLSRAVVAELATTKPNGDLRITPIWFGHQDGSILMSTWENTVAARNIKRNPRCSMMIDYAEAQPYYGVHFYGTASIEGPENDPDAIARLFTPYIGSYDGAFQYAQTLISWGKRIFIRFTPERKVSWDFRQG